MIEQVKVILRDGSQIRLSDWQSLYGLRPYSNEIGRYFSLTESRFQKDIDDYGELIVHELLMRVLDGYREAMNQSTSVNSFNRNKAKQAELTAHGYRTATHSPHEVHKDAAGKFEHGATAVDVDTPGIDDLKKNRPDVSRDELWKVAVKINRESVRILKEVANKLKITIRIGNEEYLEKGQTFIHFDVAPEFYAPGKPWNKFPHPAAWEKKTTW
jgi:hypothetical protein